MTQFEHEGKTYEVVLSPFGGNKAILYIGEGFLKAYLREVKPLPTTPGSVVAVDGDWHYFLTDNGWVNQLGDRVYRPSEPFEILVDPSK